MTEYIERNHNGYAIEAPLPEELTPEARQALEDALKAAHESSDFRVSSIDEQRVERVAMGSTATSASLVASEIATAPKREYDPFSIPDLLLVGKHIERLRYSRKRILS
ncbi:MAG: hypothetical protein ABI397_00575 [Candidatus Saccharimonas sp.]